MAEMYKCRRCGCDTPNKNDVLDNEGKLLFTFHWCDSCDKRWNLEYEFQAEGETIRELELICPWCQTSYEDYDAWAFDGGEDEVECQFCGKHFDLEIETRRRYSTKRSICDMPEDYGEGDSNE